MKLFGVVIADDCEFAPVQAYAHNTSGSEEGVDRENRYVTVDLPDGIKLKAVLCGIGKVNAASAASFLIAEGAQAIFNIGLSGSLEKQPVGGIIIGESTFEADFDLTAIGYDEFVKPGQTYIYKTDPLLLSAAVSAVPDGRVGALACGDYFLADAKKSAYFHERYGITAFDMESGAIASVCHKSGVPFLALRQISDSADENASDEYRKNNEEKKPDLLKALLDCIREYNEVTTGR